METRYILQSRHSASQGVTKYLMISRNGRHNQLTSSTKWARSFTSIFEAAMVARIIGGMKVVEVEVTK